jgi:hypothetical protein
MYPIKLSFKFFKKLSNSKPERNDEMLYTSLSSLTYCDKIRIVM